ncbi:hypothetical protein [Nocardia sp. IFM 10818]
MRLGRADLYASDGSTIGQNARLRILPAQNLALTLLTNGSPRESFYKKVFDLILPGLGAPTVPELPRPDPALRLDPSRYTGVYARPGTRFEVTAEDDELRLTLFLNPMHAQFMGKPERLVYRLLPVSETHFLMPSDDPLEDTQTVAIYDVHDARAGEAVGAKPPHLRGQARYLHTNSRVHPRA